MIEVSVAYPEPTPQVEAIIREIQRLQSRRPELLGRIQRAEHILVTHLSCPVARPVKVRIHRYGTRSFTVHSCSKLRLAYTVNSEFECDCPDSRRRHAACKHSIACYILDRVLLKPRPSRTIACFGCGEQTPHEDLNEIQDYHESLTWFPGDLVCSSCW